MCYGLVILKICNKLSKPMPPCKCNEKNQSPLFLQASIIKRNNIIIIIIIIIIYSIYRALIPNGPKALYIIRNDDKILNLQNYIVIL